MSAPHILILLAPTKLRKFNEIYDFAFLHFFLFLLFQKVIHSTGSEDEQEFIDGVEGLTMNDGIQPSPGGAFSALTPSMWPQEILTKLSQPEV